MTFFEKLEKAFNIVNLIIIIIIIMMMMMMMMMMMILRNLEHALEMLFLLSCITS